jgi:hypothetical protein
MADIKALPGKAIDGFKKAFNIGRENYIKAGRYGPRGMNKMSEEEAGRQYDHGGPTKKHDMRKVNGAMRRFGGPSK